MRSANELADFFEQAALVSAWVVEVADMNQAFDEVQNLSEEAVVLIRLQGDVNLFELRDKLRLWHRSPPFLDQWSDLARALREIQPCL